MSGGKKLARNVYVGGNVYAAGSTPPKEIADQITNEKAWAEKVDDRTPAQKVMDEKVAKASDSAKSDKK